MCHSKATADAYYDASVKRRVSYGAMPWCKKLFMATKRRREERSLSLFRAGLQGTFTTGERCNPPEEVSHLFRRIALCGNPYLYQGTPHPYIIYCYLCRCLVVWSYVGSIFQKRRNEEGEEEGDLGL